MRVVFPFDIDDKTDNLVNTSSVSKKTEYSWTNEKTLHPLIPPPNASVTSQQQSNAIILHDADRGCSMIVHHQLIKEGTKVQVPETRLYTTRASPCRVLTEAVETVLNIDLP